MLNKCILILGPGRCGSSVLAKMLNDLGIASDLGECGEVVFDVFSKCDGAAHSLPGVRREDLVGGDFATIATQQALNLLHNSTTDFLVCKPVGLTPTIVSEIENRGYTAASEFYWRIIKSVFPDRHTIFMVRDPVDWMLSAHIRWGFSALTALRSLHFYLQVLKDGIDMIDYVGRLDYLNISPKEFVDEALDFLVEHDQARCVAFLSENVVAGNIIPDNYDNDVFWSQTRNHLDIDFHSEILNVYQELSNLGFKFNISKTINARLIELNKERKDVTNTLVTADDCKYKAIADEIWESKQWLERVNNYLRLDIVAQAKLINEQNSWIHTLQARLDIK